MARRKKIVKRREGKHMNLNVWVEREDEQKRAGIEK